MWFDTVWYIFNMIIIHALYIIQTRLESDLQES